MMMTFLKYHANFNVFIIKSGGLLERAQFRKSGDFNFNSAHGSEINYFNTFFSLMILKLYIIFFSVLLLLSK